MPQDRGMRVRFTALRAERFKSLNESLRFEVEGMEEKSLEFTS